MLFRSGLHLLLFSNNTTKLYQTGPTRQADDRLLAQLQCSTVVAIDLCRLLQGIKIPLAPGCCNTSDATLSVSGAVTGMNESVLCNSSSKRLLLPSLQFPHSGNVYTQYRFRISFDGIPCETERLPAH